MVRVSHQSPPMQPVHRASEGDEQRDGSKELEPPPALLCISRHFAGIPRVSEQGWVLEVPGFPALLFDDGREKTFDERLAHPDLEDQLTAPYFSGLVSPVKTPNGDPGRVRVTELFYSRYGTDEASIRANLVDVDFFGTRLSVHGLVAPRLLKVVERLLPVVRDDAQIQRYFRNIGGAFNYRQIEGTARLSPHSFGIAIDLNSQLSAYHLWTPNQPWHGALPEVIVDAFEAEGFIWGGRWFHYDTMHFEYRPELLDPDCGAATAQRQSE